MLEFSIPREVFVEEAGSPRSVPSGAGSPGTANKAERSLGRPYLPPPERLKKNEEPA